MEADGFLDSHHACRQPNSPKKGVCDRKDTYKQVCEDMLSRLTHTANEEQLRLAWDYAHSRDSEILFDEDPHEYCVRGEITPNHFKYELDHNDKYSQLTDTEKHSLLETFKLDRPSSARVPWMSVTSVVGSFFSKFDADAQAERMAKRDDFPSASRYRKYRAVCRLFLQKHGHNEVVDKDTGQWGHGLPSSRRQTIFKEALLFAWEKNREEASSLGTALHREIELFYNGITPQTDPTMFPEGYSSPPEFSKHFMDYHAARCWDFEPFRTEMIVFDEEVKICGSVDMLYRDREGGIHIRDWKRSREIKKFSFRGERGKGPCEPLWDCNFSKYSLQLNIYSEILRRKYNIEIQTMAIVVFHPNARTYKCHMVRRLPQVIEGVWAARREQINGESDCQME